MIFWWLRKFFAFVRWLVVPPTPADVARIDPNIKCPICGARSGRLRAIVGQLMAPGAKLAVNRIICQHTCNVCGARSYERAIVSVEPPTVQKAVARDAVEVKEDVYGTPVVM